MSADISLNITKSFVKERPQIVAGLLEQHDPHSTANLFKLLGNKERLKLLELMLPTYTARVSIYWSDSFFAALLSELELIHQLNILRCIEAVKREEIILKLPSAQKINLKPVLSYDARLVGSWMNPIALFIPSEDTVVDALNRIRNTDSEFLHDPLFVIDRERTVLGKISVYSLLKASKSSPVSSLMDDHVATIYARISLDTASSHPAWHTEDILPVINQNEKVLGVIEYISLVDGLEMINYDSSENTESDVLNDLLKSYGEIIENLADGIINWSVKFS